MEFMFVSMFQWAKKQGYATFSLGLSALSGTGEHSDDPAVERAIHYLFEHLNRFYNFKGLHEFKEKFHPSWQPRYLIYPGTGSLPAVAAAIVRANTGDDFFSVYFQPHGKSALPKTTSP
jgi:phosphatidylglycerol lysyltransferase